MPSRRSILKSLATIPLLGASIHLQARTSIFSRGREDLSFTKPSEALQVLRFINTAELWSKYKDGSYLPIEELLNSRGLKELLADDRARKKDLGKAFFSTLDFRGKEIIPGWNFQLFTSPKQDGYAASIHSQLGSLSTDNKGIIYEGVQLSTVFPGSIRAQDVVSHARPVGSPGLLREVALGLFGVSPQIDCCPCICECTCRSQSQPLCFNCGCIRCCIWCCCPY